MKERTDANDRPGAVDTRPTGGFSQISAPIWAIFVACLIPEIWFNGASFGLWGHPYDRVRAFDNFGFWAGLLRGWTPNYAAQPYLMFLSYGFLHGGIVHFGLNMLTLLSIGPQVERSVGPLRFTIAYVVMLVAGGVGFLVWPVMNAPMVGASGALFGLAGMILGRDYLMLSSSRRSVRPILRIVGLLAVLNGLLWYAMDGQLAWQTHLGGFVAGWLLILWFERRRPGAPAA